MFYGIKNRTVTFRKKRTELVQRFWMVLYDFKIRFFFFYHFSGKRVAIVGAAPSQIGKNNGGKIDSHDVVVRINLLNNAGKENDFGSKTTFRFIGATMLELHLPFLDNLSDLSKIITTDKNVEFFSGRKGTFFYERKTPRAVFSMLNQVFGSEFFFPTKKPPRSGIVFLAMLLFYSKPKCISLFGFSDPKDNPLVHINKCGETVSYSDKYRDNHCPPEDEIKIIEEILKANLAVRADA